MNTEYFATLTEGEQECVEWQYHMQMGSFKSSLWDAIANAGEINLMLLAKAYPSQIEAYVKFSTEPGWWQKVQKGLEL